MATDLTLLILHRNSRAVVCARWLGEDSALSALRPMLPLSPNFSKQGLECWSELPPTSMRALLGTRAASGSTPEELTQLSQHFPTPDFAWLLVRDY